MKQKIRIIDNNGKVLEHTFTIRNLDHFNVQLNTRSHVFKSKKGKGSFKRKQKYVNDEY